MIPRDCSMEELRSRIARRENYAPPAMVLDSVNEAAVRLFGATISPLMAHPSTPGRFANPSVPSPRGACSALLRFASGGMSMPYSNEDFLEIFMCLSGALEVRLGSDGSHRVVLNKDDLLCVPIGVEHVVQNSSQGESVAICLLNGPKESRYRSFFSAEALASIGKDEALTALGATVGSPGIDITQELLAKNTARFSQLQPYKTSLSAETALPAEAVEYLTASSVYPVLVPEKYKGRNRHAPLRGLAGLNLSIAECTPGDGPLPHAHSQTQESFFALEGEWDISCGNKLDCHVPLKQHDLIGLPVMAMRAFKNVGTDPARLLVIIQQEDVGMTDVVAYTPQVGQEVHDRYGAHVVEAFRKTNFDFDAMT